MPGASVHAVGQALFKDFTNTHSLNSHHKSNEVRYILCMKKPRYGKVSHPQLHSCVKPGLGPTTLDSEPVGNQAQKRLFSHFVYTYGSHYMNASGTFSPNSFTIHCTVIKVNLIVTILRMGFLPYPSIPWISSILPFFFFFIIQENNPSNRVYLETRHFVSGGNKGITCKLFYVALTSHQLGGNAQL